MIRKILGKILFCWSVVLVFGLFGYGVKALILDASVSPILILLLPPLVYFLFKLRKKECNFLRLLAGFSMILIFIIFLVGIKSVEDLFFVGLILPVVFWFLFFNKGVEQKWIVIPEVEEGRVEDENLRVFLKTLGGVGLGVLLSSLLNPKQAGAAFFGSIPGPGTVALKDTSDNKINPAREDGNLEDIKNALTAYGTNDIDEYDSTTTYVGKEDKDGNWVIQKIDTSSGVEITYATQTNNPETETYLTAWTNRTSLNYSPYHEAF